MGAHKKHEPELHRIDQQGRSNRLERYTVLSRTDLNTYVSSGTSSRHRIRLSISLTLGKSWCSLQYQISLTSPQARLKTHLNLSNFELSSDTLSLCVIFASFTALSDRYIEPPSSSSLCVPWQKGINLPVDAGSPQTSSPLLSISSRHLLQHHLL